jgi:hypothetical protein
MLPDPSYLLSRLDLHEPLIGVYDAPDPALFDPVVHFTPGVRACLFEFYQDWMSGRTLILKADDYGCGGCGTWWFNRQTRSRAGYLDFLANKEGLKASEELMATWFDAARRYEPQHGFICVGPLKDLAYEYLKTITFYVNPDQLSVLMTGAQYHQPYTGESPVTVDFGSGCMELMPLLEGKEGPRGIVGATDMAMRNNLPPEKLAFTVNKAMYENLCRLDEKSFLAKPFLKMLKNARGGRLSQD